MKRPIFSDKAISRPFILLLVGIGLWLCFSGGYIHAKAYLAQYLLERSWHQRVSHQHPDVTFKPWPWADTHPVAKIAFPRLNWSAIILHGASGEALAFGPGHMSHSVLPGDVGNSVIAGHRDTHFRTLKLLRVGDRIEIERPGNGTKAFVVSATWIVDENDTAFIRELDTSVLTLITCYPFDATVPGGPLRFIVRARAIPSETLV